MALLLEIAKYLKKGDFIMQQLETNVAWKDLQLRKAVLAKLKEIAHEAKKRSRGWQDRGFSIFKPKGIIALFSGRSGTGKTMAAQVLAGELDMSLYKIDLSSTVSKYIGETEKNLDKVFKKAKSNTVLFFDEADALFGKRTSIRKEQERFTNTIADYLLERIERYKGLVILASNNQKNLKPEFLRHIKIVVDF